MLLEILFNMLLFKSGVVIISVHRMVIATVCSHWKVDKIWEDDKQWTTPVSNV